MPAFDQALGQHIDAFVESQRQASGIPGIALAVVNADGAVHLRGFGHDGRGVAIGADTPFPIGSMAAYVQMLLAGGVGPGGRLLSSEGLAQLLAPAAAPAQTRLLSADFQFRYGEGWFVGPFGAASDARWHLGNLASFAAWVVLLPQNKQAVVLLINANTELPFNEVNAVVSRLPIGVVNLLRGQPVPQGPSLRRAYGLLNAAAALVVFAVAAAAWWAARTRRTRWSVGLLVLAVGGGFVLPMTGLSAPILAAFAPDFALVLSVTMVLLCLPAVWRVAVWARRGASSKAP